MPSSYLYAAQVFFDAVFREQQALTFPPGKRPPFMVVVDVIATDCQSIGGFGHVKQLSGCAGRGGLDSRAIAVARISSKSPNRRGSSSDGSFRAASSAFSSSGRMLNSPFQG